MAQAEGMKRNVVAGSDVAVVKGRGIVVSHRSVVIALIFVHLAGFRDRKPSIAQRGKNSRHMNRHGIEDYDFAVGMWIPVEADISKSH
ncbi:hypothetical protein ACVWXN_008531 [Bradyrhizobium sp. i1.4.4]